MKNSSAFLALVILILNAFAFAADTCTHNLVGKVRAITPQKGIFFTGRLARRVYVPFIVEKASASKVAGDGAVQAQAIQFTGQVDLFLDPENALDREMLALLRSAGERDKSIRVILEHSADDCFTMQAYHSVRGGEMYLNALAVYGIIAPR